MAQHRAATPWPTAQMGSESKGGAEALDIQLGLCPSPDTSCLRATSPQSQLLLQTRLGSQPFPQALVAKKTDTSSHEGVASPVTKPWSAPHPQTLVWPAVLQTSQHSPYHHGTVCGPPGKPSRHSSCPSTVPPVPLPCPTVTQGPPRSWVGVRVFPRWGQPGTITFCPNHAGNGRPCSH